MSRAEQTVPNRPCHLRNASEGREHLLQAAGMVSSPSGGPSPRRLEPIRHPEVVIEDGHVITNTALIAADGSNTLEATS